jgi:hypothetical protein
MITLLKKTTFMLALGCGLILSQNTMAHEDGEGQEAATPTTLSTNYTSKKAEVNDLIAQDSAKNFAYQVKRHAKENSQTCPCPSCGHYLEEAKKLWSNIRNADTNTEEAKGYFKAFANCEKSVSRLPQGFSAWLKEHGYEVTTPTITLSLGGGMPIGLNDFIMMMMMRDLLSGQGNSNDEGGEAAAPAPQITATDSSDSDSEDDNNLYH